MVTGSFAMQTRLRPPMHRECPTDETASAATSDGPDDDDFGPIARPRCRFRMWEPLLSGDHDPTGFGLPRTDEAEDTASRRQRALAPSGAKAPSQVAERPSSRSPVRRRTRSRSDALPSPAACPRVRHHTASTERRYAPRTTPHVDDADSMTHRCGVNSGVGSKCWRQVAQVLAT